jgi:ArsR family transcriptional regulator
MIEQELRVRDQELRAAGRFFQALKDIMRLRILYALAAEGEMTVTALARALGISQPLVSFHLRPLRQLGLVAVRRCGREVFCSLNAAEIADRLNEFTGLLSSASDRAE